MQNFQSLGLQESILNAITKIGFSVPTPIQAQTIPVAFSGRDILGSAKTGTGKTAAFSIPMISYLLNNDEGEALVVVPTRELAMQVMDAARKIIDNNNKIKTVVLIGGESIDKQLHQIRTYKPRLIIGTPGRINDHLNRKSINLSKTKFFVIDEIDRMLDMGFGVQIDKIIKYLPKERQTLMFSATLFKSIVTIAEKYLIDPIKIFLSTDKITPESIIQKNINMAKSEKYDHLLDHISKTTGSIIVFVNRKCDADKLVERLKKQNQGAEALHGGLRQNRRERVISSFRKKKYNIMVATDIAARGLDIDHIEFVVNYDIPMCPEDYIHRIGRTARAGAKGEAVNFITSDDMMKWKAILRLLNEGKSDTKDNDNRKVIKADFSNNNKRRFRSSNSNNNNGSKVNKTRFSASKKFRAVKSK
jgi:ATP-dependent RNA helicase DeaD